MTLSVPATEFNKRLSKPLENSSFANEICITSQTVFWRLVGLGIVALGLGAAVGLACIGYAYIARNSVNVTALSEITAKALGQTKFTGVAEGTVQIEPHEISLATGQMISFDPSSTVLLDPKSIVKADGQIELQAPSISTPQGSTSNTNKQIPTITNCTVFKRVPYQNGAVMTGWNFLTSNQPSPSDEYCYYSLSGDKSNYSLSIDIAHNRELLFPKTVPQGFDVLAAFNKCVWFKGANP
jgi:hypothetical protein